MTYAQKTISNIETQQPMKLVSRSSLKSAQTLLS